jgi:hypothetical protein
MSVAHTAIAVATRPIFDQIAIVFNLTPSKNPAQDRHATRRSDR